MQTRLIGICPVDIRGNVNWVTISVALSDFIMKFVAFYQNPIDFNVNILMKFSWCSPEHCNREQAESCRSPEGSAEQMKLQVTCYDSNEMKKTLPWTWLNRTAVDRNSIQRSMTERKSQWNGHITRRIESVKQFCNWKKVVFFFEKLKPNWLTSTNSRPTLGRWSRQLKEFLSAQGGRRAAADNLFGWSQRGGWNRSFWLTAKWKMAHETSRMW